MYSQCVSRFLNDMIYIEKYPTYVSCIHVDMHLIASTNSHQVKCKQILNNLIYGCVHQNRTLISFWLMPIYFMRSAKENKWSIWNIVIKIWFLVPMLLCINACIVSIKQKDMEEHKDRKHQKCGNWKSIYN